jgi:endo-1,4-beta-xylanase
MDLMRLAAVGSFGALACQSIVGLGDRSQSRGGSGYAGQDAVAGGHSAGAAGGLHEAGDETAGNLGRVARASGGVSSAAPEAGAAGRQDDGANAGRSGERATDRGGAGGRPAVPEGGTGGRGGNDAGGQSATVDGGSAPDGGAGGDGLSLAGASAGGPATSGGAATVRGGAGGAEAGAPAAGGVGIGGEPTAGAAAAGGAAGGDAPGGAGAGGAEAGGTAAGGAGTGGTGAASTGGVASGGAATGGASTGGVATGGAATGGSASGGATGGVIFPAKFVGNTDTRGSIRSDFTLYWDQFTPENAGQWGAVQPSTPGSFNWGSLDAMYTYCVDNDIPFKQRAFVGGTQQPAWVDDSNAESAVKDWIDTFCTRYPKVALIDVVNDPPPHTTPAYKDGIGGDGASGWDWIANVFQWARDACPNAVLILNDYNNIEFSNDAQHTVDIVHAIQSLGAPIDAVGCEALGAASVDTATLEANLDKIATETGLPIFITEYDVNIADDDEQERIMREQFTMFWQNDDVKGITLWGYVVGSTWRSNSGLIQSDGTMRPAMTWLMQFLDRG